MKPSHHEIKKKVLGGLRRLVGNRVVGYTEREAGRRCVANKLEQLSSRLFSFFFILYLHSDHFLTSQEFEIFVPSWSPKISRVYG